MGRSDYVGVMGAQPCVGLILIPPDKDKESYVFHFTGQCNAIATLRKVTDGALGGYKAVLCGAYTKQQPKDEYEEADNQIVEMLLYDVCKFINQREVTIIGYVPGPNVHVDCNGRVIWTIPRTSSTAGY